MVWPWRMFSYICLLSYIVVVSDWLLYFGISRFVFKAFWQYVRIPLICTNITINCSIRLFRIHTEVTKWFLRYIRLLWEILYTCKYPPVVGASSIVHSIAIPPETGDTSSNNAREYRQKSTINIFLYFIVFFSLHPYYSRPRVMFIVLHVYYVDSHSSCTNVVLFTISNKPESVSCM